VESDLFIYPDEHWLDRGVVEVTSHPNTNILLAIPQGNNVTEFTNPSDNALLTIVSTDAAGKATAGIRYKFDTVDNLLNHSPSVRVIGYYNTYSGQGTRDYGGESYYEFKDYSFNANVNWNRVMSDYMDPAKCPEAKANPCMSSLWILKMYPEKHYSLEINGMLTNVLTAVSKHKPLPGITYKGMEQFTCQAYQERLMSWFYKKRQHADKRVAAQVNGLEMLPYTILGGSHNFVALVPAGVSLDQKEELDTGYGVILDPWWSQDGPRVFSVAEQMWYGAALPGLANAAGLAMNRYVAAVTITLFRGGPVIYANKEAKDVWIYVDQIVNSAVGAITYDHDYDYMFNRDAAEWSITDASYLLERVPPVYPPECPGRLDVRNMPGILLWTAKTLYQNRNLLEDFANGLEGILADLHCPVAVTVDRGAGEEKFTFNLVDGTSSGPVPGIVYYEPDAEGGGHLGLSLDSSEAQVEIEALADGTMTVVVANDDRTYLGVYEDVVLHAGERYQLPVAAARIFAPLVDEDGTETAPRLVEVTDTAPPPDGGSPEGGGGGGGGCFLRGLGSRRE
jgi:hypothetical protein